MKVPFEYAIAICPPEEIVMKVKLLKDELCQNIGGYKSRKADGHITIKPFNTYRKLLQWEERIQAFCKSQKPFDVIFPGTGIFPDSRTLYLAPDFESNQKLIRLLREFLKLDSKADIQPHISIARGLTPNKLEIGKKLFEGRKFDISFTIDNLAIRKFNYERQQYDVYKRFYFGDLL